MFNRAKSKCLELAFRCSLVKSDCQFFNHKLASPRAFDWFPQISRWKSNTKWANKKGNDTYNRCRPLSHAFFFQNYIDMHMECGSISTLYGPKWSHGITGLNQQGRGWVGLPMTPALSKNRPMSHGCRPGWVPLTWERNFGIKVGDSCYAIVVGVVSTSTPS